ncbi:MAG: response regulator [Burkholderiaceae bacterium]|jgi:CheY-like chemotaxis protein
MRILVADDNRDITDSFSILFEVLGHEVQTAYNGLEACQKAVTFRPEAALLDIRMPGKHGYDVALFLRSLDSVLPGRLIGMTGEGGPEAKARALASGFSHLVIKPASFETILELLNAPDGKERSGSIE